MTAGDPRPERVILLVEDSAADAMLVKEAFGQGSVSLTIHECTSGTEGLAFLRRQGDYADAPVPDLVLLDINMPGMNGLEMLREIKACAVMQQIPVIMLTSSSADRDLDAAYRIGANSYVVKPMSLSGLQEAALKIEGFWLSLATPPPRRSTVRKYDPT